MATLLPVPAGMWYDVITKEFQCCMRDAHGMVLRFYARARASSKVYVNGDWLTGLWVAYNLFFGKHFLSDDNSDNAVFGTSADGNEWIIDQFVVNTG